VKRILLFLILTASSLGHADVCLTKHAGDESRILVERCDVTPSAEPHLAVALSLTEAANVVKELKRAKHAQLIIIALLDPSWMFGAKTYILEYSALGKAITQTRALIEGPPGTQHLSEGTPDSNGVWDVFRRAIGLTASAPAPQS